MTVQRNFHLGDVPVASAAFANVAGTPTAPTAVTVKTLDPAGTSTTYTSPNATISLGTTTTFTFPAPLTLTGKYWVQIIGTGGVLAGDEEWFVVERSMFD